MNRKKILAFVVFGLSFLTLAIPSRTIDAARSFQPPQLSPAETQADFDLMRKALEEAHTGLYRYLSKPEMDRVFTAQRAKLNRPMSKTEFLAVLMETTAAIRCGHTGVQPDAETQAAFAAAPLFPMRIMIEKHNLIVSANDTPNDSTIRPGMEILEINGRTTREIFDRIMPTISTDGDIEIGKWRRIEGSFNRNYWLLIDQAKEFAIKARGADGKTANVVLPGVTAEERKKNQNPVNNEAKANIQKRDWAQGNLSLRFLKDPEIAQIRIRGFGGADYPQWMENTFRTLREKGTKTLVIDLRGNGGGNDMYGAMLVSYLTDKPFRYFDHIRIKTISLSFKERTDWSADDERNLREGAAVNPDGGYLVTQKLHPGVAEQPPGKYPFLGQVIVLINGRTFSTAADFCAVAHHLKRATFIGEETGGAYYGNNSGEMPALTLPNSKAQVRVPLFEYWNAVPGYDGKRRGTRPDLLVETTAANLLRGVDEQLEAALKLAAKDSK
jgi:C-terminal processing protease CtpA/Prc